MCVCSMPFPLVRHIWCPPVTAVADARHAKLTSDARPVCSTLLNHSRTRAAARSIDIGPSLAAIRELVAFWRDAVSDWRDVLMCGFRPMLNRSPPPSRQQSPFVRCQQPCYPVGICIVIDNIAAVCGTQSYFSFQSTTLASYAPAAPPSKT